MPVTIIDTRTVEEKKEAYQYPHCEPPSRWDTRPATSEYDGVRVYKTEVAPGSWMWMPDPDREAREYEEQKEEFSRHFAAQKHNQELWYALQSRLLSEGEMIEIEKLGRQINTPESLGYSFDVAASLTAEHRRTMERLTAYYNQARLQLLAKGAKWPRSD